MTLARCAAVLLLIFPMVGVAAEDGGHAGWISIMPPLLAIVLALVFRQVIPALFLGLWFGAWAVNGMSVQGLWDGLLDTYQIYVLEAVADADHAAIVLFSLMIGGAVGIISRNGGMQGVVNTIAAWANNARRACIATATMGLAVFFDDYANTLVVGNTMRSVTDSLKVSREKLAYLVDSTAAPVSCLAFVTTWIGYEVGLIDEALKQIGSSDVDAYAVFLGSIPYSFYPILTIFFVFLVATTGRDFGAMLAAERRAREQGIVAPQMHESDAEDQAHETPILPVEGKPQRAYNAILPIMTLVAGVIVGLYATGTADGVADKSIREIVGDADSYKALLWASLLAVVVAGALSLIQGILSLRQVVDSWFLGARSMLYAMIILVLAWSLSSVAENLGTANFLVSILGDSLNPGLVPALVFLLAAATAFATGSSWGTMGILMPLVIPLTWAVLAKSGDPTLSPVLFSSVSCVLAGAVWGDHCSPISDTTILSSMASGCDHIEHVRTQLPYAVLVAMVALIVGTLPTAFGLPWWLALGVAAALLFGILQFAGEPVERHRAQSKASGSD